MVKYIPGCINTHIIYDMAHIYSEVPVTRPISKSKISASLF